MCVKNAKVESSLNNNTDERLRYVFNSVANLGILSQDLGIFLGHWDFLGILILRIRPWDFSWDFSEFRENNFKYKFLNS